MILGIDTILKSIETIFNLEFLITKLTNFRLVSIKKMCNIKVSTNGIINLYSPTFSGWALVFVGLRPDKVYATPHMVCGFFTVLKLFASDIV